MSVLKSPTVMRLEDGSFYGWEGVHEIQGSCEGTCQHVWNYAYALKVYFKTSGAKIIGFDNIDILDDYKIPISSVAYSSKKIAHEAVKSITESRTEDVIVDYSIIWR